MTKDTISVILDFVPIPERTRLRTVSKLFNKAFMETIDRNLKTELSREEHLKKELDSYPKGPDIKAIQDKIVNKTSHSDFFELTCFNRPHPLLLYFFAPLCEFLNLVTVDYDNL